MRCYFMRDGHIAAVEVLVDVSDAAAIAQAQALFAERREKYGGFEVWDRARFVYRFPADVGGNNGGNKPKPAV